MSGLAHEIRNAYIDGYIDGKMEHNSNFDLESLRKRAEELWDSAEEDDEWFHE